MRTASTERTPGPRVRGALLALLLGASASLGATARGGEEAPMGEVVLVGLLRSRDPTVERDLEAGVRLALDRATARGGPRYRLLLGETVGPWGTVGSSAVGLAREGVVALIAPPERDVAHLALQVASKVRVVVVATSAAPGVAGTGSPWVVRVVPRAARADDDLVAPPFDPAAPAARAFVHAFRAAQGREPTAWCRAGYDAAAAVAAGCRARPEGERLPPRGLVRGEVTVVGADDVFRFVVGGERRSVAAEVAAAGLDLARAWGLLPR